VRAILETTSLFVLLAVVALRPLIAESYDSAGSSLTEALGAVSDPRPLHTLVIDLLILLAALGAAFAYARGGRRYRKTGMEWGFLLIAVAAAASCVVAGNKRLAVNATLDWLCGPILAMALVQLLRGPWARRLLLAAVLASAAVQSAQCIEQATVGFDETWKHYQSIREDFWARQAVSLDSPKVDQFERRLQAREATGFLQHGNIAGSYLLLCALTALGLCVDCWRRWWTPTDLLEAAAAGKGFLSAIGCTGIAVATVVALVLTKSRGAMYAGAVGLAGFAGAGLVEWFSQRPSRAEAVDPRAERKRRRLARGDIRSLPVAARIVSSPPENVGITMRERRMIFIALWGLFAVGVLAVVGYGWVKGTLPGSSLMFRWQYWTAALQMFLRYPLTGVGRENFGRHYTQFKSIESPEEVANPHNLLVQAACDWGVIGLLGLLALLVGWTWRLACTSTTPLSHQAPARKDARGVWVGWALALFLVVTAGRIPLLGSADVNFLYYASMTAGVVWLIAFGIIASPDLGLPTFGHRAATAAALAFLVHELINFALFVPATATTFFALVALTLTPGVREAEDAPPPSPGLRRLPAAGCLLGLVVLTALGLVPVARAERNLDEARARSSTLFSGSIAAQPAHAYFDAASAADPLDPTADIEHAEWLAAFAEAVPQQFVFAHEAAIDALRRTTARDPHSIRIPRISARLRLALAERTHRPEDYVAAVSDATRALALYPANPGDWVALADVQAAAGEATSSNEWLQEAALNYAHALKLDDQRLAWETIRRLRPSEKSAIEAKLARVRELLGR
jgi:hypothetical protein